MFKYMPKFMTGNDTLLFVGKVRINGYVSDTIYNRSEATQTICTEQFGRPELCVGQRVDQFKRVTGTIFLNQFLSIVKGLKLCHSFTNFLAEDQVPLSSAFFRYFFGVNFSRATFLESIKIRCISMANAF